MRRVPPDGDLELSPFAGNFDVKLSSQPTVYGTTAAEALIVHNLTVDFQARLATVSDPETRTRGTIAAKNTSKKALIAKLRQVIRVVNAQVNLSEQQRIDLGLNPRDVEPTPIGVPTTRPVVLVDNAGYLRLADETQLDRKGKPVGVMGAFVYTKLAAPSEPAPDLDGTKFAALATRTSHQLSLPADAEGKRLYVFAQWVNERGQAGPTSAVASATIAA